MVRQTIEVSTEEARRQTQIIEILSQRIKGKGLTFCLSTFGCQMNARDSEKIKGMLEQIGYIETEDEKNADFVLYNTCCIRENAETKIYGRLGELKGAKKKNPNLMVALCGCMMQEDIVLEKLKKNYPFIDIIFGTYNIYKLPELLQARLETNERIIDIWDSYKDIVEDLPDSRKYDHKACINIMYGCDNFCTYCIVPYVRGRERSRSKEDILNEARALVAEGVTEIMLLGQNVNSYGKGLDKPATFAQLLDELSQIEGLRRIRFMTPHPKDFGDDVIDVIAKHPNICNNIHLPVQSGSSKVLKAMNRNYTKEQYLNLVDKLKAKIPGVTLTTDIIVGFPGETDEDVEDTLDVVEKVGYSSAFTFIYSKREGTPAAKREEIPAEITKERFNRVLELVNKKAAEALAQYQDKRVEVLFEEISKNNKNVLSGRTDTGILVNVEAPENMIGKYATVTIIECKSHYLVGRMED